ncbi:Co2+/Mg2+ efflux protein ApaG [Glaciecola sp. MH2013]|uniref:Co2+/Mg2+ efflux protein ApaG n=1 Tax=Glaciecola sp. MH2013 TaxID=2785524 RepID=UPI00189E2E64|nr:Co2+/Mg2+ efflux protein ApaG [Glaciecola sp. MH2013]MBF7075082.1 Co2+/Mg2+ efflux protein ApaG [Glaciecola sp. MH2013]
MEALLKITTSTQFIGKQNNADLESVFVFSYTVTITNLSQQTAQLKNRYWLITNGDGEKVEVKGPGVIGEQPFIKPNLSFEYTSASMLKTQVGTMEGYYEFEMADGQLHREAIPVFTLAIPNSVH